MAESVEQIIAAIKPVTVGQLPAFVKAIEPLLNTLTAAADDADNDVAIFRIMTPHAQNLLDAVVVGANVERDWLEQQTVDVLVKLGAKVLEVNSTFFLEQILPVLTESSNALTERVTSKLSSMAGSADSSAGASVTRQ